MEDYPLIRILVLRQHLDIGEKEKSSIAFDERPYMRHETTRRETT